MFWRCFFTVSLLSILTTWGLPLTGKQQTSRGQVLEIMNMRDIVLSVGPRKGAIVPIYQQVTGHFILDPNLPEIMGLQTDYEEEAAGHSPLPELVGSTGTRQDEDTDPLLHSSRDVDNVVHEDVLTLDDMEINSQGIQSDRLRQKKHSKQNLLIRSTIMGDELSSPSGSLDKPPSEQTFSNSRGIWDLLPPAILMPPRLQLTPEQMEEIAETGRLCTEDGECVYFSGGWGEACCPFG